MSILILFIVLSVLQLTTSHYPFGICAIVLSCPSSIYIIFTIVLSVLLRFTASDNPFKYFFITNLSYLDIYVNTQLSQLFKNGLGYGVQRHFQQYFSCIVVVSFIGRGNRSTLRKPLNCNKSLTTLLHC